MVWRIGGGRLAALRGRGIALAAALLCASGLQASATGSGDTALSDFEILPCWGPALDGVQARCGFLSVPESRERPNGREIQIAVTILLPDDTPPGEMPAPLVYLAGGPGFLAGLSGVALAYWQEWYAHWDGSGSRSLILVDPRGTGESEPRLQWAIRAMAASKTSGSQRFFAPETGSMHLPPTHGMTR